MSIVRHGHSHGHGHGHSSLVAVTVSAGLWLVYIPTVTPPRGGGGFPVSNLTSAMIEVYVYSAYKYISLFVCLFVYVYLLTYLLTAYVWLGRYIHTYIRNIKWVMPIKTPRMLHMHVWEALIWGKPCTRIRTVPGGGGKIAPRQKREKMFAGQTVYHQYSLGEFSYSEDWNLGNWTLELNSTCAHKK